jgi:hypothetical protein
MRRNRPQTDERVTIRLAGPADTAGLDRLAALDSRPRPSGDVLVAEVGGEMRAALPLGDGEPIADPFAPTAALLPLLALRARQLERRERPLRRLVPAAIR